MLTSDRLHIERIKLQNKINTALETRSDSDEYETRMTEAATLKVELAEKNEALIAALDKEDKEAQAAMARNIDTDGWTPETRDFRDLAQRVTIVDYVDAVINNNGIVRGAAAEYNEHVFGGYGKPGDYPVEMLLDRDEKLTYDGHELKLWKSFEGEERTVITGPTGTHGAPSFVDRILADTEAAFLGTMFPTVGPGPHAFPIVTGSTVASTIARGTAETAAGGVTINDVTPERVQHSYEIDSGDELRLPGVFGYLAADLRRSLAAGIDKKVIDDLVTANPNPRAAGSTTETLTLFLARYASLVNGRSARTINDVRVLLGTLAQTAAIGSVYSNVVGGTITNVGTGFDILPHDRVRGSAHLPVGASDEGPAMFYGTAGGGGVYAPVWRRGNLLRDTGRLQLRGQVTLTGVAYTNVVVADTTPYAYHKVEIA